MNNWIERKIYRGTQEYKDYLRQRLSNRFEISFEYDGHRWRYEHTSFDDNGDYDVIARPSDGSKSPETEDGPDVEHILQLAAIIRKVDGNNTLGAAALAEAILSHPNSSWKPLN